MDADPAILGVEGPVAAQPFRDSRDLGDRRGGAKAARPPREIGCGWRAERCGCEQLRAHAGTVAGAAATRKRE